MRSSRTRCRMNLEQKAREDVVLGFGKSASDSVDKYLYEYESEAACFGEGVRTTRRNLLIAGALDTIQPAYESVLAHHRSRALDTFKMSLDSASDSNEGFGDIVRHCSEIVLIEFDRGCAGAIPLPHGSTECSQSCICCVTCSYFPVYVVGLGFQMKETFTLERLCFVSLDSVGRTEIDVREEMQNPEPFQGFRKF